MSGESDHSGEAPSSVASISDTTALAANSTDVPSGSQKKSKRRHNKATGKSADFVATAKRQGMVHVLSKKEIEAIRFMTLIQEMGRQKLEKPFLREQLFDLRNNDKPDGYYSTTSILAIIAAARTLPYASDAALQLAQDNGFEINPVDPHVHLQAA